MKPLNGENPFFEEVYSLVGQIPAGKVLPYGGIAAMMGRPRNSRMVGQAMWAVPHGRQVPYHRVVNRQGRTAPNWPEQRGLLESEGVAFTRSGNVDMKKHTWKIMDTEE